MAKRPAAELQAGSASSGNESKKPFRAELTAEAEEGMGEFEDGWEDEFESDEEVADANGGDGTSGNMCIMYHCGLMA